MGKNYDNWERLVTAVLRRERDKQIALTHSTDPSSICSTSSGYDLSSSSTCQLDHIQSHALSSNSTCQLDHLQTHALGERSQIPMDYPELTLDHTAWKTMLPPDKRGIVWRSASLSFFLDQRTGKNCFLLGAENLVIASGDGLYDCWERKFHWKSRFCEVAKLVGSRNLYIEGNIKPKMLSPETSYAAYLVFGFSESYAKLHSAVSIIRDFYDESGYDYPDEQARMVRFQEGNCRADGWKEIQLGDFYVGLQAKGEVQVQLLDTSGYRKSGLIVEGIEFRPLEGKIKL